MCYWFTPSGFRKLDHVSNAVYFRCKKRSFLRLSNKRKDKRWCKIQLHLFSLLSYNTLIWCHVNVESTGAASGSQNERLRLMHLWKLRLRGWRAARPQRWLQWRLRQPHFHHNTDAWFDFWFEMNSATTQDYNFTDHALCGTEHKRQKYHSYLTQGLLCELSINTEWWQKMCDVNFWAVLKLHAFVHEYYNVHMFSNQSSQYQNR